MKTIEQILRENGYPNIKDEGVLSIPDQMIRVCADDLPGIKYFRPRFRTLERYFDPLNETETRETRWLGMGSNQKEFRTSLGDKPIWRIFEGTGKYNHPPASL